MAARGRRTGVAVMGRTGSLGETAVLAVEREGRDAALGRPILSVRTAMGFFRLSGLGRSPRLHSATAILRSRSHPGKGPAGMSHTCRKLIITGANGPSLANGGLLERPHATRARAGSVIQATVAGSRPAERSSTA